MNCKKESNLKKCNCTYTSCKRLGVCCECIAFHRERKELPACYFSKEQEKTFDRSLAFFLKCNK